VDWKTLAAVFATVFLAEPGDKTQVATVLFASDMEASPKISPGERP
jgi:putative Ca2+/H+ antiporter (TMEM165/GDT1 family)